VATSTTRGGIQSDGIGLRRERLGRRLLVASPGLFVGSVVLFACAASSPSLRARAETMAMTGFLAALLCLLLGFVLRHLVIRRRGTLQIGPTHLVATHGASASSDALELPLETIEAGWATSPDGRWFAELRLRSGAVLSAVVADREQAQAIVAACGVGPEQRALRMKVAGAAAWLTVGFPSFLVGLIVCAIGAYLLLELIGVPDQAQDAPAFLLAALLVTGWVAAWMRLLGPPWVVVGRDGVMVESGFRRRFIAYEKLSRVYNHEHGIALELVNHEIVRLSASDPLDARTSAVIARIDEARLAWLGTPDAPDSGEARLELLDRGSRSIAEWRMSLAKLREKTAGYRGRAGLRDQELLDVLSDARAPAERKIGAALALAGPRDPAVRARIAVAAAATANESLGRALEALASGEADASAIAEAIGCPELVQGDEGPDSRRSVAR
jgi:hypothetical protein